jgi:hypothetical protein
MSLVFRRAAQVIAGSLLFLAVGILAPSPSAAVEFTIERVSDQAAIVSVVPGQGQFDMSSDTPALDGHPFPTGWRTAMVELLQPFDATTNYSGTDDPIVAQLAVNSWGTQINTLQQNGYDLNGGTEGVTLLNWGATGVSPPWCVPPCLDLFFSTPTPPLPISGDLVGSVDVTLNNGNSWGSVGTTGTVACGFYTTNSWNTSFLGPTVGTYTIVAAPEPSSLALLGAGGIGLAACVWRRQGLAKGSRGLPGSLPTSYSSRSA